MFVLLAIGLLLVLLCAGVSFESIPVEEALRLQALHWNQITTGRGMRMRVHSYGTGPVVREVRPRSGEEGTTTFHLAYSQKEDLDGLVLSLRKEGGGNSQGPVTREEWISFVEGRVRHSGYTSVRAELLEESPPTFLVSVRADRPYELVGAHQMRILFGALKFPLDDTSVAESVVVIQMLLAGTFAGSIGVLVAVLVCASFVPNMLQKGTLDPLLARPLGRARLLLFKYLGGLWFVTLLAAFITVGCGLALGVGSGFYNSWFVACTGTVTAVFAVVYSVTVLFGVLTRSFGASALLSIGVWWVSSIIVQLKQSLPMMLGDEVPAGVQKAFDVAYAVLPKTSDIGALNIVLLSRSQLSEEAYQRQFGAQMPSIDWAFSLGTTAAFVAVMLGLAVWVFGRRDY